MATKVDGMKSETTPLVWWKGRFQKRGNVLLNKHGMETKRKNENKTLARMGTAHGKIEDRHRITDCSGDNYLSVVESREERGTPKEVLVLEIGITNQRTLNKRTRNTQWLQVATHKKKQKKKQEEDKNTQQHVRQPQENSICKLRPFRFPILEKTMEQREGERDGEGQKIPKALSSTPACGVFVVLREAKAKRGKPGSTRLPLPRPRRTTYEAATHVERQSTGAG